MNGILTLVDFLTIMDSIAKQVSDLSTGFTSAGWANNVATILAEADILAAGALDNFGYPPTISIPNIYATRMQALNGNLGNLNTFLTANNSRVHWYINTILKAGLQPAGIFPPVYSGVIAPNSKLGSYVASGGTTGAFTAGVAVDKTLYGQAWLTLHMTHNIGGSLIATIIGLKYDGTAQSKAVTLTGHSSGDQVVVGTLGTTADNFNSVSSVTITGGTNLDAFDIETQLERVIAL